jgi:predicted HicB family RNase H-like nuclease
MTGKKIEFLKKPTTKETSQFIDNWVSGSLNESIDRNTKLKRTTLYLPEEMHKQLKVKAAAAETTMTQIIIESIEKILK